MREPVTTIERSVLSSESQTPLLSASRHSAAVSCASAGWLTDMATAKAAAPISRCDFVIDNSPVARSKLNGLPLRSEEHTSELQSLMRISYAVFCLKKKTQNHTRPTKTHMTSSINTLHQHM